MVFSTPIFLFGFLPVFLAAYYLVPRAGRNWLILLASTLFYAWWRTDALIVLYVVAGSSYAAAKLATQTRDATVKTWAVRAGVAVNLAILGWFKYTTFILGNLNTALGGDALTVPEIILPIGLSFLTFQSISYILDVARGDAPPARKLSDFLAFSSLFPQLIAGPVLRYKDLAHQFETREHSVALFCRGARRFIEGLAMKLLIADSVAPLADRIFALSDPTVAEAWLGALAYSIQLLFDFAGYSAMAIGLGLMIGFHFPENFDAPYTSRSITEFWRRWHISLSRWLRDYLYVPLGGNRGGRLRTYRNLVLTMVLGGIWHGANWTFVVWGLWHGGLMALERALGAKHRDTVWPRLLAWPVTMICVVLGWVVFRAASLGEAMTMYAGMFGAHGLPLRAETVLLTAPTEVICLALGMVLSMAPRPALHPVAWAARLQPAALSMLCLIAVQARTVSPFLYFQF
ncbi:putative poly(beta-D-mannuronate) O-acetylase [Dinoroseobacter shibae DFL 12 = DSM 16493]|jgi:alginate O-acetyltransferase complex protein AlgI|uniref:Probable alginate O-acetylase AlgI n=1 Tax=Dinoroseobacter shibae (strain DSM 16493 / NCIMB 14021 / DFL 12) TaxID=398580 RepID=A8LND1_DINSH|nr:MBOAT family protein [Dinoroseobacter shibae]ABV93644.1 putative poly(beta-D-mannuronate) O-acetylase [Dinoroseobacter shibae DFL 12 = DSM 16493]URF45094.1 MBOAT family protein [Dinoroseobacter shibae]URF49399.1 MBOAT family protein [Dinoroseobacter shibae]